MTNKLFKELKIKDITPKKKKKATFGKAEDIFKKPIKAKRQKRLKKAGAAIRKRSKKLGKKVLLSKIRIR